MPQKQMSFEQASAELEEILARLADEDTPLGDALKLYARAAELVALCNKLLREAQLTVEEIGIKLETEATIK